MPEHLDARYHPIEHGPRQLHVPVQHAVDAEPDDAARRCRFDVHVAGALLHRVPQQQVGQLDNGALLRIGGRDRGRPRGVDDLDEAFHVIVDVLEDRFDDAVLRVAQGDRVEQRDGRGDLHDGRPAGGEPDGLFGVEVDRCARSHEQVPVVLTKREHLELMDDARGQELGGRWLGGRQIRDPEAVVRRDAVRELFLGDPAGATRGLPGVSQ